MSEEQKQENEQAREDVGTPSSVSSKKRMIAFGIIGIVVLIVAGIVYYNLNAKPKEPAKLHIDPSRMNY